MEYINSQDYDYIINKYHDTAKPFDPFSRFIRHDEIFSPETGMDPEDIISGIWQNDALYGDMPHPIRKARAFEYVLKNTRIRCDSRDIFPAINMVDRPLAKTLIGAWRKEVFEEIIPEVNARRIQLENDGVTTTWPDYDHSTPVWERIFSLGFVGLLRESESIRASRPLSADEDAFFEGIRITYSAIIDFLGRLEELAKATDGSEMMADALHTLRHGAPKSFYEALLLSYIYFMSDEHIAYLQVRSLSNFDRQLMPFWAYDLERGVPEEELRRQLAYYFLQFTAIGNYWCQPVYLGGEKADGSTEINDLSYAFLDVYDKMGIYNPKVQIKVAESTPKDFLLKALDMIRRGHSSIVFVSDSLIRRSLMRNEGVSEEEARLAPVTGCYEYGLGGVYGCGMNYLNLLKPLEYALHRGKDGVNGAQGGLTCPAADEFSSFEEFYEEYKRQLLYVIDLTIDTVNSFEDYLHYINPQSLLSATFPKCLEKGRDALAGGTSCLSLGFAGDLADSLSMIKKYVFDKKELTLSEFVAMLDADFEGNESFRRKLLLDRDKYGNNKPLPDGIVTDIVSLVAKHVQGRPNSTVRGGHWQSGFHVARMSYIQAGLTASSPNGRKRGEELSKNLSASMGQNREGATAAILSITKIDATEFVGDSSLDLGLLPSAVKGEDGLEAMYGLLMTFVRRGGHAMHINVFDANTLRDAQAHPEKYSDLQIRVCGWNVLWNNINKEEQDGFIRQAEALV